MPENSAQILLIENNALEIDLTLATLRELRMAEQIQVVQDGAQALEFLYGMGNFSSRDLRQMPKMILLDLQAPKVSGLEVLRRIRADHRTRDIPVILLLNTREERDRMRGCNWGVIAYLVKPITFDKFIEAASDLSLAAMAQTASPRG